MAQLNIARLLHPLDHPAIRPFVDGLAHINRLAEQSPGFVWRLQSDEGDATGLHHPWSDDPFIIVNMSVWQTAEHLKSYVYRSEHIDFFRRRAEWFEKPTAPHYVLWWIPEEHLPSLEEAKERLDHYRAHGDSPFAFWFGQMHPAPAGSAA